LLKSATSVILFSLLLRRFQYHAVMNLYCACAQCYVTNIILFCKF